MSLERLNFEQAAQGAAFDLLQEGALHCDFCESACFATQLRAGGQPPMRPLPFELSRHLAWEKIYDHLANDMRHR